MWDMSNSYLGQDRGGCCFIGVKFGKERWFLMELGGEGQGKFEGLYINIILEIQRLSLYFRLFVY